MLIIEMIINAHKYTDNKLKVALNLQKTYKLKNYFVIERKSNLLFFVNSYYFQTFIILNIPIYFVKNY